MTEKKEDFKSCKIAEHLKDALIITNENFEIIYINPSTTKLLEYNSDEIIGNNIFDKLLPYDQVDIFKKGMNYLIINFDKTGKTFEMILLKKDGTEIFTEVSISFYEDNGLNSMFSFRDITYRKEVEKVFKEYQEIFHTITENSHDAIIIIDDSGKINYWNCAAETIFGYKFSEVFNKKCKDILINPNFYIDCLKEFELNIQSDDNYLKGKTYTVKALKKDRIEIDIELTLSSVKINNDWHSILMARAIK